MRKAPLPREPLLHELVSGLYTLLVWTKKRPLRRQPEDHHFGSLLMLAVTAGAFLLVVWGATKALFVFLQESPIP
jgi:hypothetical protein